MCPAFVEFYNLCKQTKTQSLELSSGRGAFFCVSSKCCMQSFLCEFILMQSVSLETFFFRCRFEQSQN